MAAKAKKRGSSKQTKKKTNIETSFVGTEIVIWMTLAASILLLISNFGFGGFVGAALAEWMNSIFGWASYVIPFLLFGIVTFLISNQGNPSVYPKTAAAVCLLVLVCMFIQLVEVRGGFVGETLVNALTPAIGIAGTYVVDIILMIICLVVITGRSALKGVKTQSDKVYDRARRDAQHRRELAMERRRIRESQSKEEQTARSKKRSDRHVEGVSFDTALAGWQPGMRELTAEPAGSSEDSKKRGRKKNQEAPKEAVDFVIDRGEEEVSSEPEEMVSVEMPTSHGVLKGVPIPIRQEAVEEIVVPAPVTAEAKEEADTSPAREKASKKEELSDDVAAAMSAAASDAKPRKNYRVPPLTLLKKGTKKKGESDAQLRETAIKLQQILQNFGVKVTVTNVSCGPSVTRYELQPEMGVKVSKIVGLSDDIKLNLAAADIRIEAPIPGKAAVGIEVPNKENSAVMLRDLLETAEFKNSSSKISFAAGKDIGGKAVVTDIGKMPHVLIAGATGSGKSVCINTLIISILYKATPDEVKLIMIDPKVVELSVY
ncbi:MAG: DNA translocase FtsK 4TM domain-containing protein, partial [Lachnospiraceae bacterium]|nr:DNA translocase FtsK 4TM domain-containing protein [Lachnospiraceae bacterium]